MAYVDSGTVSMTNKTLVSVAITGATVGDTVSFGDNVKLKMGTSNDAEFFHDGSNTYIDIVDQDCGERGGSWRHIRKHA